MSEQPVTPSEKPASSDVSDDDKLWAALAYAFTPLVPIILMLWEDKKDRAYIKQHNMQALVYGVVLYAVASITSFLFIGLCIGIFGFLVQVFWAFKAYQGEAITIPVITDFVKGQGWA